MNAAEKLAPDVGTAAACRAMGVSRATLYRRRNPSRDDSCARPARRQPRALDEAERCRCLLQCPIFPAGGIAMHIMLFLISRSS